MGIVSSPARKRVSAELRHNCPEDSQAVVPRGRARIPRTLQRGTKCRLGVIN